MTDLSDEERTRRRYAVDFARTNAELSGFALSPEVEALNARFVAGEMSTVELVVATRAPACVGPPCRPTSRPAASRKRGFSA